MLGGCVLFSDLGVELTRCGEVYAMKGEYNILLDKVVLFADQPFCTETILVGCSNPQPSRKCPELLTRLSTLLISPRPSVPPIQMERSPS